MRLGKLSSSAESRLYFVCVESILLPIGLFWFGWTSFPSVHWIVPSMAVGCATMGIFSIYLATFNYLADTYHRFASSAIAAQSCCMLSFPQTYLHGKILTHEYDLGRNLLGGIFPLVTAAMFTNLGYPEASSLLGGIVRAPAACSLVLLLTSLKGSCAHPGSLGPRILWAEDSSKKQNGQRKFLAFQTSLFILEYQVADWLMIMQDLAH